MPLEITTLKSDWYLFIWKRHNSFVVESVLSVNWNFENEARMPKISAVFTDKTEAIQYASVMQKLFDAQLYFSFEV